MNPATHLARLAVAALAAAGVDHVLVCPGSRSAPLAYALARAGASGPRWGMRHDERVAGFTALGVGVAGPGIGAVVTTSGTAVANLHPAVLEAHHAGRPLVVVTADRPPALRGTWANQTSDLQATLFGAAVRARLDLDDAVALADPARAARCLASTLAAARGTASARPGPVHLNLGFTEPLVPDPAVPDPAAPDYAPLDPAALDPAALDPAALGPAASDPSLDPAAPDLVTAGGGPRERTVVLAGDGAGPSARAYAEALGVPLLAEPSSGSRGGPRAVGPYRLLLEIPELGGAIERVVVFGRPTLSRPVTRLLARDDVEVVLVAASDDLPGPARPVRRVTAPPPIPPADPAHPADPDPVDPADPDPAHPDPADPGGWCGRWQRVGAASVSAIDRVLDADAAAGRISGPLLAREVWAARRPGEILVTAASNPVRDLDLVGDPRAGAGPVHANRGLAGIDGTISTGVGAALSGRPVRVLCGDVAFLHDAGALLRPRDEPPVDLQIVVLNDDGGGIFELLEYGALAATGPGAAAEFERLFATPHGADLAAIARGYGVSWRRVDDLAALREALAGVPDGVGVIEVRADRSGLRDLHARLHEAVRAAVHDQVAIHCRPATVDRQMIS